MDDRTLGYNGYCGSIEVSVEDDCLHGKILFITDLVTYEASSPGELEREFQCRWIIIFKNAGKKTSRPMCIARAT